MSDSFTGQQINASVIRLTAAQWAAQPYVLPLGVIGQDTDSGAFKVGDGATTWDDLVYGQTAVVVGEMTQNSPDVRKQIVCFNDCNYLPYDDSWQTNYAATNQFNLASVSDMGAYNARGVLVIALGTSASGFASITQPTFGSFPININNFGPFGYGRCIADYRFALYTLSDGTNAYTVYAGFTNTVINVVPARGAFFRYTHSVNGGRWEAVTRDADVETATDTGVPATTGAMQHFRVDVNATGTLVEFYIDDVLVASNATNIPAATDKLIGGYFGFNKQAGTANIRCLDLDYVRTEWNFTTPR